MGVSSDNTSLAGDPVADAVWELAARVAITLGCRSDDPGCERVAAVVRAATQFGEVLDDDVVDYLLEFDTQDPETLAGDSREVEAVRAVLCALGIALQQIRTASAEDHGDAALAVDVLRREIDGFIGDVECLVDLEDRPAERLSILVHLLLDDPSPQTVAVIENALAGEQSGSWGEPEHTVLARGMAAVVDTDDISFSDRVLPLFIELARRTRVWCGGELLLTVRRIAASARAMWGLWPHVVEELIVGLGGERERTEARSNAERRLIQLLPELDEEQLKVGFNRLLKLGTATKVRIPAENLAAAAPGALELLAHLVQTGSVGHAVGARLFSELRRHPARWIGREALFALESYGPLAEELLVRFLHAGWQIAKDEGLAEVSGRVLASIVPHLPASRRNEPWVDGAIRALGELPVPNAAKILRRVRRQRRRLFFPVWPAPCRRTARDALRRIRERRSINREST